MIGRLWKGWVRQEQAEAYRAYLTEELLPQLRRTLGEKGYRGYHLYTRESSESETERLTEFATLLWFDSLEAVKGFAGPGYVQAVISDKAAPLVVLHWPTAEHYELCAADAAIGCYPVMAAKESVRREVQLRLHRPGDLGWILHRHGVLYSQEYGWNERFEALVADVVSQFLRREHADKERCWVAESGGRIVGAVMLACRSDEVGLLRLLYVEPDMRGHAVGERLVQACIDFAREAGYRRLSLFTTNALTAARRIYEKKGIRLVRAEPHHAFGKPLLGETWELALKP